MSHFLVNLILALIWTTLTGLFTPANLVVGFLLGYLTLLASRRARRPTGYFDKVNQVLHILIFFLAELVLANLRVAADVLTPRFHMRPRVLAIPLDVHGDLEITMLASLISLTPGTLSLDVSTDRRVLYIHAMYAADAEALRAEIKRGLERRVRELVSGSAAAGAEDGQP